MRKRDEKGRNEKLSFESGWELAPVTVACEALPGITLELPLAGMSDERKADIALRAREVMHAEPEVRSKIQPCC